MWTKGNGVQAADSAIASYRAQMAELESEGHAIASDGQVIQSQLADALAQAAAIVLPDAAPATLARAAQELSIGWLVSRRHELEQLRSQWLARLAAIEADPQFVQRESMLHPTHGALARERQQCETLIAQLEAHLARFRTETFQWLQARKLQRQMGQGKGFAGFWDAVTFGGLREDKAKQRCAAELGYPGYAELEHDYEASEVRLRQVHERIGQLDAQRQRLLGLLEEHGELYGWAHDFEARVCQTLRAELAADLGRQDLRTVHMRIRSGARPSVARAHALQKKSQYLGNLAGFVQREAADRNRRIEAIGKTRLTWSLKPWERLTGDKSKWLLALPAAKKESTHKQTRWVRRMHHNIVDYEYYDDYDHYLDTVDDFVAYDAFAWAAEEPMPYEGFSRGVVDELDRHRREHDREKADYSAFRAADKQAGREEDARGHDGEAHGEIRDAETGAEGLAVAAAAAAVAVDHTLDLVDAS